jgi:hypothetical protein
MARRRSALARLAAPAAFLLAATVAVLLVRSAIHEGDGGAVRERGATAVETEPGSTRTTPRRRPRNRTRTNRDAESRAFYRVEPGDTLETIAAEHGTSVEQLLELNPGIDPRSLTVGQQVRVR